MQKHYLNKSKEYLYFASDLGVSLRQQIAAEMECQASDMLACMPLM